MFDATTGAMSIEFDVRGAEKLIQDIKQFNATMDRADYYHGVIKEWQKRASEILRNIPLGMIGPQ